MAQPPDHLPPFSPQRSLRPAARGAGPRVADIAYAAAALVVTSLCASLWAEYLGEAQVAILYLMPVLLVSVFSGIWAGSIAALGGVGLLNFLFATPHYTLFVSDAQDGLTLAAYLVVAITAGRLAGGLREERDAARSNARMLDIIAGAAEAFHAAQSHDQVVDVAADALRRISGGTVLLLSREGAGPLRLERGSAAPEVADIEAADAALRQRRPQSASAPGWNGSAYSFLPIVVDAAGAGTGTGAGLALGYRAPTPAAARLADCDAAAEVIRSQTELALQRLAFEQDAKQERARAVQEEMRNALLSSLSHDLRTPLAVILGAVSTLRELGTALDEAARLDLLQSAESETRRLSQYVADLLQMTRLQIGAPVQAHWIDPTDAAQAAVMRLRRQAPAAVVRLDLSALPMIRGEAALLEQALFNLLDNALRHGGGQITLSARVTGDYERDHTGDRTTDRLLISVCDQGAGPEVAASGSGLGLQICHAIAAAFAGRLTLQPRAGKGMQALLDLPIPPQDN